MSWRDIVRKAHCGTEKYDDTTPFKENRYGGRGMPKKHRRGQEQEDAVSKTSSKPDFLDLDGDGNKTEPMKEAAKNKKHDDSEKKAKMKCPKCKGKGCAHCKGTGYHEVKSKNPFTRKD